MPDFAHHLTRLLETYTYLVLPLLVLLESLGIPLPGEIALVTAAAYASAGRISIYVVVLLAAIGASVGGILGYWIGIKGGLPLVAHYGRYLGVRKSHVDRAHAFFERNGAKTILFGRFVAVLRTWAAIIAGTAAMPFKTFVTYNTISSFVWAVLFGLLGYFFGRDLPLLQKYIARVSFGVLVVVAVGVVVFVFVRRNRNSGVNGREPDVTPENPTSIS
jgi:membrane protein DedA with SNARE-associated domain